MVELNRNVAVALFAAVVVAAGCTQTGGEAGVQQTPNTGISILSFDAFPSEVPAGSTVQVEMELQNTGGQTADSVDIELFNIPTSGTQAWAGETSRTLTDLRPSDPQAGVPSSPRTVTFDLTAPTGFPQETRTPYDIFASVVYEYNTVGTTDIVLMGQERFRNTGMQRTTPSVDNTAGPISLEVRTRTPIVYYADDERTEPRFCVVVRNNGDGTPMVDGESDEVELDISSSGDLGVTEDEAGNVELVGNRGVKCYNVVGTPADVDRQLTLPVTITAGYEYEKETSTTVTVDSGR